MYFAERIRKLPKDKALFLEELPDRANTSKKYLGELDRDTVSAKVPSAIVLIRIVTTLSAILADLINQASLNFTGKNLT